MAREASNSRISLTGRRLDQYTVQEMIGAGGMGEVYRAHDERLNRTVAIKALPDRLSRDATAKARFVREAKVAGKIVHPYVATVFDIVDRDGSLFLVMEYIEGERLTDHVRRGALDVAQASQWGLEMAEGLSAIHGVGLVHRDLKPSNVMITRDGHVKIMDFGLARSAPPVLDDAESDPESEETLTQPGAGIGTVLYMSPEQIRGDQVDARSDLFALGVVLWEMVAGTHPFARTSLLESASAILKEPPGGGTEPASFSQSRQLRSVILRLLEKRPSRRYQDSGEVVVHLREASQSSASGARWRQTGRRATTVAGTVAGAALIGLVALSIWLSRPPAHDGPRPMIAIAPVIDRTDADDGATRAALIGDALASDLGGSRLLRVAGPGLVQPLIRSMTDASDSGAVARRVALGMTTDYVLTASLYEESGRYVATATLTPTDSELPEIPALQARGATAMAVAEQLASGVRRALPNVSTLTAWRDDDVDIEDLTSESEEARMLYERALVALRDNDSEEAIRLLENAIDADPTFAQAHATLAETLDGLGYGRRAREEAASALRHLDENGRAGSRQADSIRAIWATIMNRPDEAVAATSRLVSVFGDEPAVRMRHALALEASGRIPDALAEIELAARSDPSSISIQLALARLRRLASDQQGALAAADEAERIAELVGSEEGKAKAATERGAIHQRFEQFDAATRELETARSIFEKIGQPVAEGGVLLELAKIDLMRGDLELADERMQDALKLAESIGNSRLAFDASLHLGLESIRRAEFETAENRLKVAADTARQLQNDGFLVYALANLANLQAYLGDRDSARRTLEESIELSKRLDDRQTLASSLFTLADLDWQAGELSRSLQRYEELRQATEGDGMATLNGWADLSESWVLQAMGRLAEAYDSADRAVETLDGLGPGLDAAYARAQRARIAVTLGRFDTARDDLAVATSLVDHAANDAADLRDQLHLAEGSLFAGEGDLDESMRILSALTRNAKSPGMKAAAAVDLCRLGELHEEARAYVDACTTVAADSQVGRVQRLEARIAAERLTPTGKPVRELHDEARALGLPLAIAQSALLLDDPESRRRGLDSLDDWISSAPEADRPHVANEPLIAHWKQLLESEGVES